MNWELTIFISAMITVSVGCLAPARWLPPLPHDKLLHFIAFGGLALLAVRMAHTAGEQMMWLGGLLLAGAAIELLQNFVPGRRFCWRDIAANVAGVFFAVLVSHTAIRM